jgi:hypothetical protein
MSWGLNRIFGGNQQMRQSQRSARAPIHDHEPNWDALLDPGIAKAVKILNKFGIQTYESCQGGAGHSYPEPTVRFYGDRDEGFRAFTIAKQHGLPVTSLRRIWLITEDEPTGPDWEMVFYTPRPNLD